jgi:hypothetical protein
MFHRKCKAAIEALQARNDQLCRDNSANMERISQLRSRVADLEGALVGGKDRLAEMESELLSYRVACQAIAGSTSARDRHVQDALATLPGDIVATQDLPTIHVLLHLTYSEPQCVSWFHALTIDIVRVLTDACGNDLIDAEMEVAGRGLHISARYRGNFGSVCSRICIAIGAPPRPLQAVIAVQDPNLRELTIIFRAY